MTAGRPKLYKDPKVVTWTTENEVLEKFKKVCETEQTSASNKLTELMEEYVKIHGRGNPQYKLEPFIENSDFKAVPALLEPKQRWLEFFDQNGLDDIEQVENQAEFLRKAARAAKAVKIRETRKLLLEQTKRQKPVQRKALPENIDPGENRRQQLRALFLELARPSHDSRGGQAHRARRNIVIEHIKVLQELLPDYQKCQEYEEWLEERKRQ